MESDWDRWVEHGDRLTHTLFRIAVVVIGMLAAFFIALHA